MINLTFILTNIFTVEDPSENFARLRDFVDSKNCLALKSFNGSKILDGLTDEMIKEANTKLKINKVSLY